MEDDLRRASLTEFPGRQAGTILAVETSCDETAAAVVAGGVRPLSNVVSSQISIHAEYGGIVPEIASRHHLKAILRVVEEALDKAGTGLSGIDGIAVTQGPGLVGSLVVGWSFAKAVAAVHGLPLAGVNHLHAHLLSIFLEQEPRTSPPEFPYAGLAVSGGHTSLFVVRDFLSIDLLGGTRDDAAGEAFDKVAKVLGLEYPGGPVISGLAAGGDPGAFSFPRAWLPETPFDFSFSGLKTAVISVIRRQGGGGLSGGFISDLCASFQEAVVDVIAGKAVGAARTLGIRSLVACGGVASNGRLRERLAEVCAESGIGLFIPSPEYCTDNAAMVGVAGFHRIRGGLLVSGEDDVYSRGVRKAVV